MNILALVPAFLISLAIWCSLESIRPGDHKDKSITPLLAGIMWLVALTVSVLVFSVSSQL